MPRNSKSQAISVNQGDHDEIRRQSNKYKNQRQYGEGQMSGKRAKTRSGKGNKN
jgi:hypothetical protein